MCAYWFTTVDSPRSSVVAGYLTILACSHST